MTTLLLLLACAAVVGWVVRRASTVDVRDETDRFARVQSLVGGWSAERTAQSRNDLGPTD